MTQTLASLDLEWSRLTRSLEARTALDRWARHEPALSGYGHLEEVVAARRSAAGNDVAAALARFAAHDQVAARTLLHIALPGLVRYATATGDGYDALDHVLALAWERIRTYPAARPGSVAANIVLDVRKQYLRQRQDEKGSIDPRALADCGEVRSPEDVVIELDLIRQVMWATRRGLITTNELNAILRTRIHGEPVAEAAAAERVPVNCLIKRRWRGERSLRATLALAG